MASHASELDLVINIKLGTGNWELGTGVERAGFGGAGVLRGIRGDCVFGLCGIREQQDRMNKPQKKAYKVSRGETQ